MTESNWIYDSVFLNFMFALIFMKPDARICLISVCALACGLRILVYFYLYLYLDSPKGFKAAFSWVPCGLNVFPKLLFKSLCLGEFQ